MSAGVVQQQDGRVTPRQTAVQLRPSRSINVRALQVEPVPASAVAKLVIQNHYLHSMPLAASAYGVYVNQTLHGAIVFSAGARHSHRVLTACDPKYVATLARFWLSDDCPKNSESRVLGYVLRYLRRQGRWKLLVSHADPNVGHHGTIYRASGWRYLGQGAPCSTIEVDGKSLHPRSMFARFGTTAIRTLRGNGIVATRRYLPGKHRYIYLLDPSWRWRLTASIVSSPRTNSAALS